MKSLLTTLTVVGVLIGGTSAEAKGKRTTLLTKIEQVRIATLRCQDTLGVERYPVSKGKPHGKAYRKWVLGLWSIRREAYCGALKSVRRLYSIDEATAARQWAESYGPACISSHEGGVTTNTGNGYYGKWQADMGFQSSYGSEFLSRWGVASNWPEWAQDIMAYRAYNSGRGYGPWPNTRRVCGV